MKTSLLILLSLFVSSVCFGDKSSKSKNESYEFIGIPITKIGESGDLRTSEIVAKEDKLDLQCIITEVDGKFFWKTRENNEMVKVRSGIYINYIALNGSGYVRVIDQEMKKNVFREGEQKFDYKEHLLSGLSSITYFGHTP